MNWPVFIGTYLFFAGVSFVFGFIPALWVATIVFAAMLGFLYGVGRTLRTRGIETRQGGDGTAPSRSDDSPSATRRAGNYPINTTDHTQGE